MTSFSRRSLLSTAGIAAAAGAMGAASTAPAAQASPLSGRTKLSRIDKIYLERGLMHGAWLRSGPEDELVKSRGQHAWDPSSQLFRRSGFTTPVFYDAPLYSSEVMRGLGNTSWGIAQAPAGRGTPLGPPPPRSEPLFENEVRRHAHRLFSVCFGDEEPYSDERVGWFVDYYARMHQEYPWVIVHNNQWASEYSDAQMRHYIQTARPDQITYDNYYFHEAVQFPGGSASPIYRWTGRYRRLALEGHDGQGNQPVAFGQYTTGFRLHPPPSYPGEKVQYLRRLYVSESQQMVVAHVTWAFGGRWLTMFRWERDQRTIHEPWESDGYFLNYPDGSPTPQFFRYARLNRVMANYSPYLVRLRSKAIAIEHGTVAETGRPTPGTVETTPFSPSTDPATGVIAISAVNLGDTNGGKPGDVVFGSFRALPGLSAHENRSVLPDPADTTAFMIVNGLVIRNTDWATPTGTGGSGEETAQRITVTVTPPGGTASCASLYRVDPHSGRPTRVRLTKVETDRYTTSVTVHGGEGALYFWG